MSEMYSERLLDHYRNPRNRGELAEADLDGEELNSLCGDQVRVQARLYRGRIGEAAFSGRGCALCLGAASILTEFILGRRLVDMTAATDDEFLAELSATIYPTRLDCALLPWRAFRKAAHRVVGEAEDTGAAIGPTRQ